MPLNISPQKTTLLTSSSAYHVHTKWSDTVEYNRFCDILAERQSGISRPMIVGAIELITTVLQSLLADGKYVKLPVGAFYLCASGNIDSPDEAFTPGSESSGHELRIHFRPDRDFEAKVSSATLVKRVAQTDQNSPQPSQAVNVRTKGTMSGKPGDMIRITGSRLKFDPEDESSGVFFVNGSETRVAQYGRVTPTLVIVNVPPGLDPGSYALAVRSVSATRKVFEGRTEAPFTVE